MDRDTSGVEVKKGLCRWCKAECRVLVQVQEGQLVAVLEDPEFAGRVWPPTRGCVRFQAAKEYFYHPDRLTFPLKRAGEKGQGKWQQISWEQALDEIAERLCNIRDTAGGEAIALNMGTGRTEVSAISRFCRCIGTPNLVMESQICFGPRSTIAAAVAGWFSHYSVRPTTKCIVSLGIEPLVARPHIASIIREARKQGAKCLVIDPRRTRSAAEADLWLQIRPGTDCALLMGMIHVIIAEDLYDKEFVANFCHGFAALKERAQEYPPEKVAAITGITTGSIREAARLYAQNRPGIIMEGMGVEHLSNNAEVLHAKWILAGLTANIDVVGGEEQCGHHPVILDIPLVQPPPLRLSPEQNGKLMGAERFKLFSGQGIEMIAEATKKRWPTPPMMQSFGQASLILRSMITGKPYPTKAMMSVGANPMVTHANTKLVYRALKSLDLYVVQDFFMTPSAQLADYVLPIATWLERPELRDFAGYEPRMHAGEVCVPPVMPGQYDRKGDYEVLREIALRMGYEKQWPWKTLEDFFDARLKPAGYTHREYVEKVRCEDKVIKNRAYREVGFGTPTGKVEFYSTILEKLGYDPLPAFREPAETPVSDPDLAKKYPLQLITGGRTREYYHSEWRQIDSIRKKHPYPLVQIHPETAGLLGIAEGNWVWIETVRGRVRMKATLFDGIDPGVVHAEHGWWLPELPGEEPWLHGVWEVNINVCMNDDPAVCNPVTGTWPLKTALCRVYRVKHYETDGKGAVVSGNGR
jgi:thiosulfate reductase / polysulfide reductase chain A